jgi:hypothetical protein
MGMGTVGWIALGWFSAALVISLALGGFLRKASETPGEEDIAAAASKQKVMRYMRGRKNADTQASTVAPRLRESGKRATG